MRLLPGDKCLLVVEGHDQDLCVYLEGLNTLGPAIERRNSKKYIHREKTGHNIALAYDESKRTLAICGVDIQKVSNPICVYLANTLMTKKKPLVQLYFLVFDERYQSLQAQGAPINLTPWYSPGIPKIVDIHIFGGGDELGLLDDTGRLRIFSPITQQFRLAIFNSLSTPTSSN